jgi:hypothetical protein
LNNYGTVDLQTGTLLCFNSGTFTNNGAVTLAAGTTNRLDSGGSANGTFSAAATALVEWTGATFTLNPGAQLNGAGLYRINGGTVNFNTDIPVRNLDLLVGSSGSGTLSGSGAVTVSNAMNWASGTMNGGGRTIIAAGGALNMDSSGGPILTSRTLENGGTALWTGAGNVNIDTSVITNRSGALFQVQNNATL